MHFGVEGSRRGGIPQRRDCFDVSSLPSERHPEIKRGVGLIWLSVEHGAKCQLGLDKLLVLEVSPAFSEVITPSGLSTIVAAS